MWSVGLYTVLYIFFFKFRLTCQMALQCVANFDLLCTTVCCGNPSLFISLIRSLVTIPRLMQVEGYVRWWARRGPDEWDWSLPCPPCRLPPWLLCTQPGSNCAFRPERSLSSTMSRSFPSSSRPTCVMRYNSWLTLLYVPTGRQAYITWCLYYVVTKRTNTAAAGHFGDISWNSG